MGDKGNEELLGSLNNIAQKNIYSFTSILQRRLLEKLETTLKDTQNAFRMGRRPSIHNYTTTRKKYTYVLWVFQRFSYDKMKIYVAESIQKRYERESIERIYVKVIRIDVGPLKQNLHFYSIRLKNKDANSITIFYSCRQCCKKKQTKRVKYESRKFENGSSFRAIIIARRRINSRI